MRRDAQPGHPVLTAFWGVFFFAVRALADDAGPEAAPSEGCAPHGRNRTLYPTPCHYVRGFPANLVEDVVFVPLPPPDCESGTFVEYVELYYCDLAHSGSTLASGLSVALMLLLMVFYFLALGKVADRFFCPALNQLAKMLHMPDDIAGMTLLSFGNGAPDVFAQVAAVARQSGSPPDWGLAIGAVFGAGLFVTHTVLAGVLLSVPTSAVQLKPGPYLRDVFVYFLVVGLMMIVFADGVVNMVEALAFTAIYILYVGVAVLQTRCARPTVTPTELSLQSPLELLAGADDSPPAARVAAARFVDEGQARELLRVRGAMSSSDVTSDFRVLESDSEATGDSSPEHGSITKRREHSRITHVYAVVRPALWSVDRLVQVVLAVAIPQLPEEDEDDETPDAPAWDLDILPLAAPLLALVLIDVVPPSMLVLVVASTLVVMSVAIRFALPGLMPRARAAAGSALVPVIFCLSLLWLNSIAAELVALLETMGIVGALPSTVLGVTVLAWGNSVGDMVSNCAVARSGKPEMALAAIYAGPVFNALIGVSGAMLLETMRVGSSYIVWRGHGNEILLLGGSLVLGQLRALLWPLVYGWVLRRTLAKVLLLSYFVITMGMVTLATEAASPGCWLESFCT